MVQLRWERFFGLRWGNDSTADILYSSGEHSYTLLGNIKTVGDALMLAGEYPYTPLGNIETFWGYPIFFKADDRLTLLGEEYC